MTLIDIVGILRSQGHSLNFRYRKDGSIVITRIDGKSYRNKSGNALARQMAGETLSEARKAQLTKIRTPKGVFGHKRKAPLPDSIKRVLRKAQRLYRKTGAEAGKPTTKNIRWTIAHYGEAEAKRRLEQSMRYARGIAYPENILALAERVGDFINKIDDIDIREKALKINLHLRDHAYDDSITEEMLEDLIADMYDAEHWAQAGIKDKVLSSLSNMMATLRI